MKSKWIVSIFQSLCSDFVSLNEYMQMLPFPANFIIPRIYLPIPLSFCLSVCLSLTLCISLSVCLSVCLSHFVGRVQWLINGRVLIPSRKDGGVKNSILALFIQTAKQAFHYSLISSSSNEQENSTTGK